MRTNRTIDVDTLIDGRFRIERLIAHGGQASVWLARHEPLQREVALKILRSPTTPKGSDTFLQRFLLEARTMAALDHPHIVTVYDYGRAPSGDYYIAMEYVEGRRFSSILRERPIRPARTLRLLHQVCSALNYAHNCGVIHRDIKNANLLVRTDHNGHEEVKIIDFGILKLIDGNPLITQEGVVLGSPHFLSPEQIRGETFDHRADIYAVGILIYSAIMGDFPFKGDGSARSIMLAHLHDSIPPLAMRPEYGIAASFEDVVRRCLAKDPNQRYPNMSALMQDLAAYLDNTLDAEYHEPLMDYLPLDTTTDSQPTLDDKGTGPVLNRSNAHIPASALTSLPNPINPSVRVEVTSEEPVNGRRMLLLASWTFILTMLALMLTRL